MKIYDFIFTTRKPQRYYRHLAFWLVRLLFMLAINESQLIFGTVARTWEGVAAVGKMVFFFFAIDIVFCYAFAYLILPRYLKKGHYFTIFGLLALSSFFLYVIGTWFISRSWNMSFKTSGDLLGFLYWGLLLDVWSGPHITCGYFLAAKMLKGYYLKMEQREALAKENTQAELQLLKAQVHPHFLFNTLNNIYSFTLDRSPQAEHLLINLTDTLYYMINECEEPRVLLDKELKMLGDYLELEKVRYGDRLDLRYIVEGITGDMLIAPLLMIPMVENSFKHGTSQLLRNPWIRLSIRAGNDRLYFMLANGKPDCGRNPRHRSGIGLGNVKKRLELLYPHQHLLTIEETVDTFTVNMEVPLGNQPTYAYTKTN